MSKRREAETTIQRALGVLRAGGVCVLEDGQDNADLVLPADGVDGAGINFLALHGRGLICLALTSDAVARLGLPPMARGWDNPKCAYTVSIEAKHGITTGISARERAHTVRVAVDPTSGPADLVVPGHIFPVRVQTGGLLAGGGRAEAALELVELARAGTAAVFTQVLDSRGDLARLSESRELFARLGLPIVERNDLVEFLEARRGHEDLVGAAAGELRGWKGRGAWTKGTVGSREVAP
ncbi:MAG TPA: 3,4-dihydroxy-2-butanone-4-phosphate synthase [Polyangia bacterium]